MQCKACQGKLDEGYFVEYQGRVYSALARAQECPYCGTPYSPLRISKKDVLCKGLSNKLIREISTMLIDSGTLDDNGTIRNIFKDRRINPWKNRIPERSNSLSRASAIIDFLHVQTHIHFGNGLVLLLEVLGDVYQDARFYELANKTLQAVS